MHLRWNGAYSNHSIVLSSFMELVCFVNILLKSALSLHPSPIIYLCTVIKYRTLVLAVCSLGWVSLLTHWWWHLLHTFILSVLPDVKFHQLFVIGFLFSKMLGDINYSTNESNQIWCLCKTVFWDCCSTIFVTPGRLLLIVYFHHHPESFILQFCQPAHSSGCNYIQLWHSFQLLLPQFSFSCS